MKKILYIDMDGVVADFEGGIQKLMPEFYCGEGVDYEERAKLVIQTCIDNPTLFHTLEPIKNSIEVVKDLFPHFDIYFLSSPIWSMPDGFTGKRIWLENNFGELARDRLILSKRKDLAIGHFLVDDTKRNGADKFQGEHIHFGTEDFPDWDTVKKYLLTKI